MSKRHKKVSHKKKLKVEDYENCLKSTQLENRINPLQKNKVNIDSLSVNSEKKYKKQYINIKIPTKIYKQ